MSFTLDASWFDSALINKVKSYVTIFNLTNTTLGSALIVMPVACYSAGLLSSIIGSFLMAIIQFTTARMLVIHSRDNEVDVQQAIIRILGEKWCFAFNLTSGFLLYMAGVIHFMLVCSIVYFFIQIVDTSKKDWPTSDQISFSQFSIQWLALILFCVTLPSFMLKKLSVVLKIVQQSFYAVMLYILYVIVIGLYVISTHEFTYVTTKTNVFDQTLEVPLFSPNYQNLIGVYALAYLSHTVLIGIIKKNEDSSKNTRDLGIAYILVWMVYTSLGTFGLFAVAGLYHDAVNTVAPITIINLFSSDNRGLPLGFFILSLIAVVLVGIQLSTVLSVLCFFSRRQLLGLHYGKKTAPDSMYYGYGLFFGFSCVVMQLLALDPTSVIGFTGAVAGVYLIYFLPIIMHVKCLREARGKSVIDNETDIQEALREGAKKNNCRDHTEELKSSHKILDYSCYGLLLVIGTGIFVSQLYDTFSSLIALL